MKSMRLFKRGDTYYVEFQRGKKRSLKTGNKKEAEAIFNQLRREWLAGRLVQLDSSKNVSLGDFTKEYLEHREPMSSKTLKHDSLSLRLLADVVGATTPLKLINVKRLDDFKSVRLSLGAKPQSVNSYLRHIKSALSTAEEWGLITSKPKVKMLPIPKHLPHFLRPKEIDAILAGAKAERPEFHRMLVAYLWTGARRNELLALRWQDCHLNSEKPFAILTGKGDKQRSVPLLPQVMEILVPYQSDIGPVFQQINESTVTHWYKAIARACGIESHLHDLRHTAATYMIASGIPMRVVQDILGHSDIATTGIYAHVVKEKLHDEMEKLRFE
jgi:integrase